jgi:hypothetical protein
LTALARGLEQDADTWKKRRLMVVLEDGPKGWPGSSLSLRGSTSQPWFVYQLLPGA